MKLLVATADYPHPSGSVKLMYVHVRNKYYAENNIDVTVLNFSAKRNYVVEGIPVITLDSFERNIKNYDLLLCHAPNLRHHFKFIRNYGDSFKYFIFFFHGHEVLRLNSVYPKPFPFIRESFVFKRIARDLYDTVKLRVWRYYLPKLAHKSHFVFVSHWMYSEFLYWSRIDPEVLKGKFSIIPNSIGEIFKEKNYDFLAEKKFDFVTVRENIDGSKYCIDIVNELAKNNPELKFLVIGKGEFFKHVAKANNLTWVNKSLTHEEMISVFNQAKCGLMPTRVDAQGVMMCEMATFGLPLITSDIPVCHEVFAGFENVALISNEDTTINLRDILLQLTNGTPYHKKTKYFAENTSGKEVKLIKKVLEAEAD